jgi:hypothetical protein
MYIKVNDGVSKMVFHEGTGSAKVFHFLPSLLSALQLGVSFGLLNNQPPFFSPSEADYLVPEQFSFYGVRLASRPTPNLEDQGIPLRLGPTP